jgi:anhydro-N-acetylmuramic acid kinase
MLPFLQRFHQSKLHRIIGLMSGTSLDGIDAALVEVENERVHLRGFVCVPFEPDLRERIAQMCENGRVDEMARLNVELGEVFAQAALKVLCVCNLKPEEVDCIASHGQTVSHQPAFGATLQIGEADIIAERTGILTVSDFRPRDMASGGQGAPFVPFADWHLLRDETVNRIVQNIGGVANLTWLEACGTLESVRAWDCGPGNLLIDECVRIATHTTKYFDTDGALAAQGRVDEHWLDELMSHPFFALLPPKSCGREEFGRAYAGQFWQEGARRDLSHFDIIATATALTARSIVESTKVLWQGNPAHCEMIVGGGGAFNATLMAMLRARMSPVAVKTHEEFGLRADAKEAIAFALLARAALLGRTNTIAKATGARHATIAGKISFGH